MLPCQGCAYRRTIPGDAHSQCAFDWKNHQNKTFPRPMREGVSQWFLFPLNYDPIWGPDTCEARSETEDKDNAVEDPLMDLAALISKRF